MDTNKRDENYLIEQADKAISELVFDKTSLIKAYNYYSGKRDRMQFRHLEENYGLGNPTSITFTPLTRKHIDVLVGEFLTMPIKPKVSCKDKNTINNIFRDKQLAISKSICDVIKTKMSNLVYSLIKGDGKNKIDDAQFALELSNAQDFVENNFISNYEIAAQNMVQYFLQARHIDFKNKLKMLMLDMFISGEMYYQAKPTPEENNVDLRVLNPLNCFPDKNVNSPYINDSYRFVYREYLSKPEVLMRYGAYLNEEDLQALNDRSNIMDYSNDNLMLVTAMNTRIGCFEGQEGLEAGVDVSPIYPGTPSRRIDLYVVYDVEWIDYTFENKKVKQHRYHVTRIGNDIYIPWGEDKDAVRSMESPNEVKLSYNGLHYTSRTGTPYSLMIATADLQDQYDILNFFKNNIIAQSGTAGDWVDIAHLPVFLGTDVPERLQKWIAYKKSGIAMIDSSQEGVPMANTTFSGYDDTLKLQAIQAVELAIQSIENTVMQITGVYRERLGGIQQRDAVANVEVGMQQSYIVTKQYYHQMDLIIREMLLDCLDVGKIVFKNGIQGTLILGENQKEIFTSLPEHYRMTDFDVHIADSQELIKQKQQIEAMTVELVKGQAVDPELLISMIGTESITELKSSISKSIKQRKEENNQLQQAIQQSQQLEKQLQQMQSELQKAQQQIQSLNQAKIQVDQDKVNKDYEINKLKLESNVQIEKDKLEQEKRRVELEALQLIDQNKRNDEVKDKG